MKEIYEFTNDELKEAFINQNEYEESFRRDILNEIQSRGLMNEMKNLEVKEDYKSDLFILKLKSVFIFLVFLVSLTYLKNQYHRMTGDRVVIVWLAPIISGLYYYFKRKKL